MRRSFWMATFLLAGATRLAAASAEDELRRFIDERRWRDGAAACEKLPADEVRWSYRWQLTGTHYAKVAALCAAIASGGGDQDAAGWWWFTATAMDSQAALHLLPELRAKGLLAELPPPRAAVHVDLSKEKAAFPMITLADGTRVAGNMVRVVERPRPPDWFSRASSTRPTLVIVDLLVGEDGVARQPVLVKAQGLPLHAFLAFAYLRQWRFAPAKVDGKPTVSAFQVSVGTRKSR
jgi:hypothetical protein